MLLLILIATLLGCARPIPQDKETYIGEWRSSEMVLLILADGTVAYKRLKGGGSVSVNGPLKEFIGDDFVVGIWFMTTMFDVTVPPHEEDGVWKMTVDSVELTKVN